MESLYLVIGIVIFGIIFSIIENWEAITEAITNFLVAIVRIAFVIGGIWLILLFMGEMIKLHGGSKVFSFIAFAALVSGLIYFLYHFRKVFKNIFVAIENKLGNIIETVKKTISPPPLEKPTLYSCAHKSFKITMDEALDNQTLQILLKHGADINTQDASGNTILHKLVKTGKLNIVRDVLGMGARLDIVNNIGKTADDYAYNKHMDQFLDIGYAIRSRNPDRVSLLIKAGAQISDEFVLDASCIGDMKSLALLHEKGCDLEYKDKYGNTAVVMSVKYNQVDVLKWLIEHEVNLNITTDNNKNLLHIASLYGKNLLHIASLYGYDEIVKVLINARLSVDNKDNNGHSSLWYAKKYGNFSTLKLLRSHSVKYRLKRFFFWLSIIAFIVGGTWVFLHYTNPLKNKAYQYSVDHGYFSVADFLAKEGADSNFDQNITNLVASSFNINRLKYLLQMEKIDLNRQDSKGKTILHYGYEKATPNIIKLLLDNGADENIKDENGKKPCFYAVYNPYRDVEGCDTI